MILCVSLKVQSRVAGEPQWLEFEKAGDRNPKEMNAGAPLPLLFLEAQEPTHGIVSLTLRPTLSCL